MNILFLVMNFLIIFMFLVTSVLKNTAASASHNASVSSYLSSKIALQSKWEKYKYQTYSKGLRGKGPKKNGPPAPKKENKIPYPAKGGNFVSHRCKLQNSSLGKWNLSALFSAEPYKVLFFQNLTSDLLEQLYGHTIFWKEAQKQIPNLSQVLVEEFLASKGNKESLASLFPQDERLQYVFYKMLKGSGSYDVMQHIGYPPLQDFFTFQPSESTLTSFPQASYPILKTLFDDSTVEIILDLERKKWEKDHYLHSLTKEELRTLCLSSPLRLRGKRYQDLEPSLLFSHKKSLLEKLSSIDKKTHTRLEWPISKQPN